MEECLINNLPDEVFLEVFNYFDGSSLKNLMFVCKRWCNCIAKHAVTMKKLPLDLRRLLFEFDGKVYHHFHTLNIEHMNIFDHLHNSLLTHLGHSVQFLKISYCIVNAHHLQVLLRDLVQLKEFTVINSNINDMTESVQEAKTIHLRKLKLVHTNYGILKFMSNIQVSELEIVDANNRKINHEFLIEFVSRQTLLTSLLIEELNNNVNSIFLTNELKHVSFHLKNFSGLFCTNLARHEHFNDHLIAFLKLHTKTLENIKLSGSSLSPQTYSFAISNLTFLHTLEISPNSIPQENSFYKDLHKNAHMRTVRIQSTITKTNFNGLSHLFQRYPSINDLSLLDTDDFIANDLFFSISTNLLHLNHLSVLNLNKNFVPSSRIPALKSFSIKILNDIDQFLKFIAMNDSLEKINIGWIKRDFDEEVIEQIISQPNLKFLKFGGRFIANKRIYDVISKDSKQLRVLELVVNNYDEIKHLKFFFPAERREDFVQPRCLYFEESSDREPLND